MGKTIPRLLLLGLMISSSGCQGQQMANWSFEEDALTGWKITGNAFSVSSENTFAGGYRYYLQEGQFHCIGSLTEQGTLTSPTFTIQASGFVSFLLSGSIHNETTSVAIRLKEDHRLISKTGNPYYNDPDFTDTYLRTNVDLSDFLGQKAYFEIVDESAEDYLNVDGFVTSIEQDELPTYLDDANIRLGLSSPEDMREAANLYIKLNAWRIDPDQRFAFHLTGETGWINDPNGFSYYNNQVQLFYQHNPYATQWGPMHWGHATSDDFVKWDYQDIALAPDQTYDSVGAFSGSAIFWKDRYYIVYTGASPEGQVQCLAVSDDGVHFEKYADNPIIDGADLPANSSTADFRDPKMFVHGDYVYLIVSVRNTTDSFSKLLLYKTQNMTSWQYAGKCFANQATYASALGIMMECPDFFTLDGNDVLFISPQTVTNHRNKDGNVYIPGTMNWTTGALGGYDLSHIDEIDEGFDFYAPTTLEMPDGRRIMVAWMAGWNRTPVTRSLGFAGAMTFPREIHMEGNHLMQWPVAEIETYYQDPVIQNIEAGSATFLPSLQGTVQDVFMEFVPNEGKTGIEVFSDAQGRGARVYYQNGRVFLDRYGITEGQFAANDLNNITSCEAPLVNGKVKIRLLLDRYSIEVFVSEGFSAITATGLPTRIQDQVGVFSDVPNNVHLESYALNL